jgi:hypothetical protein
MRHEHRHDVQRSQQLHERIERQTLRLEPTDDIIYAAGLWALRVILKVRSASPNTMNLLGEIDCLKPTREGALEIPCKRWLSAGHPSFELGIRCGIATASGDGKCSIALDRFEKLDATLIAQHIADQRTEHMDVVTQCRVLRRKLDVGTTHATILHPGGVRKRKGRRGNPSGPVRLCTANGVESDQRNE